MNHLPQTERRILDEAVEALGTQAGCAVKLLPRPRGRFDPRFDEQFELELHGQKIRLLAEIKNVDRRPALAQIKEQLVKVLADQFPGYLPLLVAPYITEALPSRSSQCRVILGGPSVWQNCSNALRHDYLEAIPLLNG